MKNLKLLLLTLLDRNHVCICLKGTESSVITVLLLLTMLLVQYIKMDRHLNKFLLFSSAGVYKNKMKMQIFRLLLC
jgi:hypothetical protein